MRACDLPVAGRLDDIIGRLEAQGSLVLQAEPGAGKTSLVPAALALAPAFAGGRVLVLEPRRLAAVAAAERAAWFFGETAGGVVGYRVRYEQRVSQRSRVEFLTEALLPPLVLAEPGLPGVSALVLDEFHERSMHADLALALALECRELNPKLHILIMSATLDSARLAAFLGGQPLAIPGRSFPVTTAYQALDLNPPSSRRFGRDQAGRLAAAIAGQLAQRPGDILVFLPGKAEIRLVAAALHSLGPAVPADSLALHGELSLDEQRRVLEPPAGARRRVILATSIAETSLTVPRVTMVVDAGLARGSHYNPRSGMDGLVTSSVSQAQADQRRGRAGRTAPGWCLRCWSEGSFLVAAPRPQLQTAELSGLVLQLAAWGVRDRLDIRWLDEPPSGAWQAALELLRRLGLLDLEGQPTARGRRCLGFGLHPRLAALLAAGLEAAPNDGHSAPAQTAAFLAALLGEGPGSPDGDFLTSAGASLAALRGDQSKAGRPLDQEDTRRLEREYRRICAQAGLPRVQERVDLELAGRLCACAYPDRIARRLDGGRFQLTGGRQADCNGGAALADWLVALDVDQGETVGRIYAALPLLEADAREILAATAETRAEASWRGWRLTITERRLAGQLVLGERRLNPPLPTAVREAAALERLRREGWASLPESEAAASLLERLRYLVRLSPASLAELPPPDEASLLNSAADWLLPFLAPDGELLDGPRLVQALQYRYGSWLDKLERTCPEYFLTATGSRKPIIYPAEADASVALRLQELFGVAAGPQIAGRPLVFQLLSPANRPLQVTSDLPSFWRSVYQEIRNPLKARYPKHYWPENPLQAEPTRGIKPRH
ncbi:MAG: ATP-dependent helicase HrpB [Spirochaetes bacterium GWD1_61_31]|nr:MAG: ATP-dependent helicase HrpB [Spirochaetes bacterium GWB1_60_80]OHD35866.1 MAG: ATP-dependent helicase HrpB [Spirochaetes bacterium GWD1_61_31]OHD46807.1 MAG: ATP-dependent helicase HrpB [Spirochaetes bacterium GWE1_60_18]OHD61259.1 MAG: ATP-dependent helicase HrpB [Spirochaetes bacterium GWF1_60_12]